MNKIVKIRELVFLVLMMKRRNYACSQVSTYTWQIIYRYYSYIFKNNVLEMSENSSYNGIHKKRLDSLLPERKKVGGFTMTRKISLDLSYSAGMDPLAQVKMHQRRVMIIVSLRTIPMGRRGNRRSTWKIIQDCSQVFRLP
mgnify:CR=1 FL=1